MQSFVLLAEDTRYPPLIENHWEQTKNYPTESLLHMLSVVGEMGEKEREKGRAVAVFA